MYGAPEVLSIIVIFLFLLYLIYNQAKKKCDRKRKLKEKNQDITIINQISKKDLVILPIQQYQEYPSNLDLKEKIMNKKNENNGNIYDAVLVGNNSNHIVNDNRYSSINDISIIENYSADIVTVNVLPENENYSLDRKIDYEHIYAAEPAPIDTHCESIKSNSTNMNNHHTSINNSLHISMNSHHSINNNNNNDNDDNNNKNTKKDTEPVYRAEVDSTEIHYMSCMDYSLPSYNDILNEIKNERQIQKKVSLTLLLLMKSTNQHNQ
ncbi:hypothetical protein PIROE2DRAFT_16155 [Piromyces sp. E2]|nr:hypothetical protein PIROE2DRAFT_16155 [Piromyces sp. E2]|eukprot:OUM58538.1 hypothetical protein PIROE2DRAFT_16155 [Piromyces sp. E2]